RNSIVAGADVFAVPNPSRNSVLFSTLERGAEALLTEGAPIDFWSQLRQQVASQLSNQGLRVQRIARAMGLSSRTLQRRLSDENMTFQGFVEQTRRSLALIHLANEKESLEGIAQKLGYSNAGAFNRAFKRWTGLTPDMH